MFPMKYNDIDFNNKDILITGGAGFIGSNLVFYLQNNYPLARITVFDCFRSGDTFANGNLKSFGHFHNLIGFNGHVICGNINNPDELSLLDQYQFDYIFHQAAISDTRVYDQEIVMKTNVNSFYWFLNKAKKDNSTLVYASSAATYGSLSSPQVIGQEAPENPYGYSKLVMDKIAKSFSEENPDIKIVGLRFFNVYGPGEYFKDKTSSMVIQLAHQILNGKPPRLFNDSHNILRDFVYIEDVIQANIKACNPKKNGVFNVGTGKPRSFQDISDIIQYELKTNFPIDFFENPYTGYQMHTQADISLSDKYLEYTPTYSLEKGIKDYMPYISQMFNHPK